MGGLEWAENFHWEEAARDTELILDKVAAGERKIAGTVSAPDAVEDRRAT